MLEEHIKDHKTWVTHPSKNILILVTIIWLVGTTLSLLAATDLFRESLNSIPTILFGGAFLVVLKLYVNYFKYSKKEKDYRFHRKE